METEEKVKEKSPEDPLVRLQESPLDIFLSHIKDVRLNQLINE